ncbi:MAG TPA: DNA-formamidopyrimidine glycosylase family protein [Candidatus Synoicihabitans sp.]|nr:DNA-formamidopyrimidine glycosylase family protein [Candidatus Synoicihabitans sp.]
MPELPDITIYLEALERRVLGQALERVSVNDLFVLRTAVPPITVLEGKRVETLRRLGKRIVLGFVGDHWLVIHLMVAGRLQWTAAGEKSDRRNVLATLKFGSGALTLTEAGTKRRASLHVGVGEEALRAHDPGGLEVLTATSAAFAAALTRNNHTLKRALTNPRIFSGIGNAYSDEILHAARLSPVTLTQKLPAAAIERLYHATRQVLVAWTERLRREAGEAFPKRVTAFHSEMAVHGRFGQPCPVCGTAVQRIRWADNETNYCPRCQTEGRLLADRSLSRLLKQDWPRTIEEAEALRPPPAGRGR